jgi:hypothetical protein
MTEQIKGGLIIQARLDRCNQSIHESIPEGKLGYLEELSRYKTGDENVDRKIRFI